MKNTVLYILFLAVIFVVNSPRNIHANEKNYVLGLPSVYDEQVIDDGFLPLIRMLGDRLGFQIKLEVSATYEELIAKVISNDVQFAILGPVQYVVAKWKDSELVYLCTTMRQGEGQRRAYYFSTILVRKDSGVENIFQLENSSFAFIDPRSTSGYRFPMLHFYKSGIEPENFFKKVVFAGSHIIATDMLANGEVDAVATYDSNLLTAEKKHGKIFKSIVRVGPIVQLAIVANRHVPKSIYSAMQSELEGLQQEQLPEKLPYNGFIALSDDKYDNIREIYNFPFLDKIVPNNLNTAVASGNLNVVFKGFDTQNYQKDVIAKFAAKELVGVGFTFSGRVSGIEENIDYGNHWYKLNKALVLNIENGRKIYIKWKDKYEIWQAGENIELKGKLLGVSDFDNPVMEIVNDE